MPIAAPITRNQAQIVFGGGLNTRGNAEAIDPREAADGQNFDLDVDSDDFAPRQGFTLAATAPNGQAINGFAQLRKSSGAISTLIQAGTTVYAWDGAADFAVKGTVASGTRLRGPLEANYIEGDYAIVTDLALQDVVKKWDGSSFADLPISGPSSFRARYCRIVDERAIYANVATATATPHLVVGSQRSAPGTLTVANRPAASLNDGDPWFLPIPDLKPVNGMEEGFRTLLFSTDRGKLWALLGSSAKDYRIDSLNSDASASGPESMVSIGNDIAFGRDGAIDSVVGVQEFGDVQTDDLSAWIADLARAYVGWALVYNRRLRRLYAFPSGGSELFVFHRAVADRNKQLVTDPGQAARAKPVSPWSRWKTQHAMAFQPVTVWRMLRPSDGKEFVYMGGAAGQIWQLEGEVSNDAGADIRAERLSYLLRAPAGELMDLKGFAFYRKRDAVSLEAAFQQAGSTVRDTAITLALPLAAASAYFGGAYHFGGPIHFGPQSRDRLYRQYFSAAGKADLLQLRLAVSSQADFAVSRFELDAAAG
ncbi:MAG: hypothetical protein L6R19_27625 [Alphaproteobacteria bacterium]|nr:hypothetical protein [Alphaproteobacteria bacterium]